MVIISRISKIFYSIRWRFAIIYLLLIATVFGIVSIAVTEMMNDHLIRQQIDGYKTDVSSLSVQVAPYLLQSDAVELYNIASNASEGLDGRMLILSASGIVLTDSASQLNGRKIALNEVYDILLEKKASSYGFHKIYSAAGGDDYEWALYSTAPIISNGKTIGVLLYASQLKAVVDETNELARKMLLIYVFACLVIIIVSMIVTQLVTKPVQELTETAIKISSGDLESRTHIKGKTELAELGQTFNMMCDRLQNIDQQRSEFVSDASHELKTPLASMKILVESILYQDHVEEAIYKDFLSDINIEIDRLNALITDLLLISKMDSDQLMIRPERMRLTEIVQGCMDEIQPIAEKQGVTVELHLMDDVEIECDPLKLRQAINNLVSNAVKYSRKNGHVDITVKRYGANVHVIIQDNGVGMSEAHLAHIFERFYRVDKARARVTGGTGLGLHIVRRVALMHGGRVEVKSEEGQGSVFTLILPMMQPRLPEASQKEESEQ